MTNPIFKQFPPRFTARSGKVPTAAGCPIDPHLPSSWKTYDDVKDGDFGIVLSGCGLVLIDIDHAKLPDGTLDPTVADLVQGFLNVGAYYEKSSSGEGIHVIGRTLPGILGDHKTRPVCNGRQIEVYSTKRFVALTGDFAQGNPNARIDHLLSFVTKKDGNDSPVEIVDVADPEYTGGWMTDDELIAAMLRATPSMNATFDKKTPTNRILWEGQAGNLVYFYPSDNPDKAFDNSRADQALCNALVWWAGKNPVTVDRLFRRSGLMRDKWDRADYRNGTIAKAINGCKGVYNHPRKSPELAITPRSTAPGVSWDLTAVRTANGQVPPVLSNAVHYLRSHTDLTDRFLFDEMESVVNVRWKVSDNVHQIQPLTDHDILQTTEFMQSNSGDHLVKIAKETVADAISMVARQNSYHPVRDYLNGLQWDGVSRLDSWLTGYYGADNTPYVSGVGRMWMISAVARIMDPGCKVDTVLILEGDQGVFKSTGPRILAGDRHFSDGLPDISHGDKDLSVHLSGKWIVEIPEMASTRKADSEALKAFLTRREERYRPPYGRLEVIEPRQCVFIITTNKDSYLRDETGARRFWPVKAVTLDVDALKRDRDQLWAEAVYMYRQGTPWWPDAAFEKLAKVQTNERFEEDPWAETVVRYLKDSKETTVGNILELGLNLPKAGMSTVHRNRVLAILRANGWVKGSRTSQNQPYVRVLETV